MHGDIQSEKSKELTMHKLSCVVPVTRMAGELGNLESWVRESIKFDLEIIIVHDIQDFQTGIELQEIIKTVNSKNIKLIKCYVGSPGLARNLGLEVARGDWIAFWDSDDLPQLTAVMESIDEYPNAEVIVGRYKVLETSSNVESSLPRDKLSYWGIAENPGIWRMIFRGEILRKIKFKSIRMAEDQVFISQLNLENKKLVFTGRILYTYLTGRPTQLTKMPIDVNDLCIAFEQLLISHRRFEKNSDTISLLLATRVFLTIVKRFRLSGVLTLRKNLKHQEKKISKSEMHSLLSNTRKIIIGKFINEN